MPNYDFFYNGKLSFTIDEYHAKRKSWNDGKIQRIEDEIGDIVIGIMEALNVVKEMREEREIREERRRQEEIRRWELEKQRDKETERIERLLDQAEDFSHAQKLYEYIEAIEKLLPDIQDDKQAELIQYLSWARQKANWLNPLIGRVDEVLGRRHEGIVIEAILNIDENDEN